MTPHPNVESFRWFLEDWLPQRLGEVVNLLDYEVVEAGDGARTVRLTIGCNAHAETVEFPDLPAPSAEGVFTVAGRERVVALTADRADLEQARIRGVGEQLRDEIEPRLVALPDRADSNAEMAAAWLPVDRWINDFLLHSPTSQPIEDTNWLAHQTHLRRLYLPENDAAFHPSHLGRVCPIETPEGPNIGRVLYLALGAEVREGRIVIVDDAPQRRLGLGASFVPLLEHNDIIRQLMGCNRMRQWLPLGEREPALVRTGAEPNEAWCGRNLLTAFIFWRGMNHEDGIVLSESAAAKLASPERLDLGDKLSNRHGTKGTVGAVLPDEEMPHTPDGRAVELLFDMGRLHTRGNFGQIREAVLGNLAHAQGTPVICPPFQSPPSSALRAMLRAAGLPEDGQTQLTAGRDGAPLDQPSTVGYVYWGKTSHRAAEKLTAWPCSPLRLGEGPGVRQSAQRQGELESWALQTCGAHENLIENLHTRSLDRPSVDELPAKMAAGPVAQSPPPSALFEEAARLLRIGGIRAVFTGTSVEFGFAEPGPDDVPLATSVPHPWLPNRELTHVGLPAGDRSGYAHLLQANERARRSLSGDTPESIRRNACEDIATQVRTVLEGLDLNHELRLGNRVAFSARAVVTPGHDLQLGEIGLPEPMAWALFGPLVAREIGEEKAGARGPDAEAALQRAMANRVVLANRAPTLQPTNVTAFCPVLRDGPSIRLHPLCCRLFNADFDGDQMAVLLPVTEAAQDEAREKLSLEGHLRLDPGGVLACLMPVHSHLFGLAWAARNDARRPGLLARWPQGLPEAPRDLTADWLLDALRARLQTGGASALLETLQALLELGVELATRSGASLHPFVGESLHLPPAPDHHWPSSWYWYSEAVESAISCQVDPESPDLGPQLLLVQSGARGNLSHLRRLTGPCGLMGASPWGGPVVTSGLREGLTAEEYFDCVPRTRASLSAAHGDVMAWTGELRKQLWPKGDTVLARALRARDPGPVLAQAALNHESDPLTDPGVRLWMGMRPE